MFSGDELIPRLVELYEQIDAAYAAVAESVGLTCEGCDGVKCCTVDLTLHTFIEMEYLRRGLNTLESQVQLEILGRCRAMVQAKGDDPLGDAYRGSVCALNFRGKCVLYKHRPMICRLAGIPHSIVRPDGKRIESGGCSQYEGQMERSCQHLRLNRTEYYKAMALFEMEVVRNVGKRTSSRTVAETLDSSFPDRCQ